MGEKKAFAPGMRSLLRGRAHALMAREGMAGVNRKGRIPNGKMASYFSRNWREWAAKNWPKKPAK